MDNKTKEQGLIDLGLTPQQAEIYSILLNTGLVMGKYIVSKASIKKGLVYKVLEQLIKMGLVEKKDRGNKASLFFPAHPRKLQNILEKQKEKIDYIEDVLEKSMPMMISKYNLLSGKPNVQFFEGLEGIEKVAFDSLESNTDVLSFVDTDAVIKYYPKLNEKYVKSRLKNNVKKKIISTDSETLRKEMKNDDKNLTEQKIIKDKIHFATVVMIYDGKVSFITLDPNRSVGIIIEDPDIYKTHKAIFEYIWNRE